MTRLLALVVLLLASLLAVNAQSRATNQSPSGALFDEIVVSSDLSVKRKSKESRLGKQLDFTNVQRQEQRETTATGPTGKQPRARLDFGGGGGGGGAIRSERRMKRGYQQQQQPPTTAADTANFGSRKRLKTMKKGKERSLKDKQKPR